MSTVTTHVLNTATGEPAAGVPVRLEQVTPDGAAEIGRVSTSADGRVADFGTGPLAAGTYRLIFDTAAAARGGDAFFPEVTVTFVVDGERPHYHVPLLLSPFGYTTYRGS